jgi:quinol monooxygenase YgiN
MEGFMESIPSSSVLASLLDEDAIPMSERPFASSIDSTLRSETDKAVVYHISSKYKRTLSSSSRRGCLFLHHLQEVVFDADTDDIGRDEAPEQDRPGAIAAPLFRRRIRRSMALWRNEECQKQHMFQAENADYMADVLPLYTDFPKFSFWIQVKGRALDSYIEQKVRPTQQKRPRRNTGAASLSQPGHMCRELLATDFVMSRVWRLSSDNLTKQCLVQLVLVRPLALAFISSAIGTQSTSNVTQTHTNHTAPTHNPTLVVQSEGGGSKRTAAYSSAASPSPSPAGDRCSHGDSNCANHGCRDCDLYVAHNMDSPYDVLEYSVWNSQACYEEFKQQPNVATLLTFLESMQRRDTDISNINANEILDGQSRSSALVPAVQPAPPATAPSPIAWQKMQPS